MLVLLDQGFISPLVLSQTFCFEVFEGLGNIGLSGALDEIRGMETFHNLHSFAFDNSDSISFSEKKIFFGREDRI